MKIRKKDGTFKEIIYSESQLYNYGINRLSEREFGRKELSIKMKRLQPDMAIVETVLSRLEAKNYLSDERRAKSLIRQFIDREGLGKVKQRLALKGLSQDVIAEAMNEVKVLDIDEDAEEKKAMELLLKKFKIFTIENSSKMYRFLASKGFQSDDIQKSLKVFKKYEINDE